MDIHSNEWKGHEQLAGKDLKKDSTAPVIDLTSGYVSFTASFPLISTFA
jgi:hypothetical protein